MENILLAIHLLIAIALVAIILVQKSEGGALGIGGSQFGMFTARGSANFLTRTTAILAACFIATSLLLTIISGGGQRADEALLDELQNQSESSEPAEPEQPAVPLAQ